MPILTQDVLNKFGAVFGACSQVTPREATGDKSVTLDRFEKEVLFHVYSHESFTRAGGAANDGKPSHHLFNVLNRNSGNFETHQIAIKYPKALGNELRLYFNRQSNFYPEANDIWFIFLQDGNPTPFIGFMKEMEWDNIASGEEQRIAYESSYALDDEDELYQKILHSPQAQAGTVVQSTVRYQRNPSLAATAIKASNYSCQADTTHQTFTSAASGKPYVEVHHLIPISQSGNFMHSLDVHANLVVLCPNCHRAIHFGTPETKRKYLNFFYNNRINELHQSGIGISFEDLCSMYGA